MGQSNALRLSAAIGLCFSRVNTRVWFVFWLLSAGAASVVGGLVGCTYTDLVAVGANTESGADTGAGVDANVETRTADAQADPGCDGLYCFGFEEPVASSGNVAVEERNGALAQDCTRSRTGNCSAAATLDAPGGVAYLAIDTPALEPSWFVRAYVWVPDELVIDDVAIIHVGTRGGSAGVNVDLRDAERVELFAIESDQPRLSPEGVTSREEWMCFVLQVQVSDTTGTAVLSLNERVVLEEMNIDTSPPNGVEFITVGIDWSSSAQPVGTLWFDDIVVGTERLGCD